jgi:uncharacterized protein YjbJ (UPF0337 family)
MNAPTKPTKPTKVTQDVDGRAMPQPTPAYDLSDGTPPASAHVGVQPTAAKGDDALMSQSAEAVAAPKDGKIAWKSRIGPARAKWNKLSEDELMATKGQAVELASLVEKRYGIKRPEAVRQVDQFLAQP